MTPVGPATFFQHDRKILISSVKGFCAAFTCIRLDLGIRRRGREFALQVLYEIDVTRKDVGEALDLFWENFASDEEARSFCERLVRGVIEHCDEINGVIERYAQHWKMSRMTQIDRNILRMAVYELAYCQDIPPKVTINEAVEIGKRFGSEDSGAFINGILDQVTHQLRPLTN